MYQLGLVFHATPGASCAKMLAAGAPCVAHTSCCSVAERSPQTYCRPSLVSQIRPSTTLTCLSTSVAGNFACMLCDVSPAAVSGASALINTRAFTRGSVPAAVITEPPYECPTSTIGPFTTSIAHLAKVTSFSGVLSGYCAAMQSYPCACNGPITLVKHEPSAQRS